MRSKTTSRYINKMLCLLAFLLRIELGEVKYQPLTFSNALSNAASILLEKLRSQDTHEAVHRLLMAILRDIRVDPYQKALPACTLYVVFSNTTASGMITYPDQISGKISHLKWSLRATGFHDICMQLKKLNPLQDDATNLQLDADVESPIMK
jgi:hypothetical protein